MRRTKADALATREALLDAAEEVFFRQGVSGTSLADIAQAASMTRGAIYWHFADKGALFEAMQVRARLPQEHHIKLLEAPRMANPLDVVHEGAIAAVRHFATNERSKRICTIMLLRCEYVGEMSEVLSRLRQADFQLFQALEAAFQEARDRGLLNEGWTAEAAAFAQIATMTGLLTQWLRSDCCFDLMKVGEPMLEALARGFRNSPGLAARSPEAKSARQIETLPG